MREYEVPMSDRERVDDFHIRARDFANDNPDSEETMTLMEKASGVILFDGLVTQVLGDPNV